MKDTMKDRTPARLAVRPRRHRLITRATPDHPRRLAILAITIIVIGWAETSRAQTVSELRSLSLEDLANIQITTVSKSTEPLSDAPAAVYVITHEDIMRSGAT